MPHHRRTRTASMAVCFALVLAGCGEDDTIGGPASPRSPSPTAPTATTEFVQVIEVGFAGGQVTGGVETVRVDLGAEVRLRVTSDVAEEVHVHTYDRTAPVEPGRPAEIQFAAGIPGRHEVELEKRHRALLVLEVR